MEKKQNVFMYFLWNYLFSFDTEKRGFSGRKLSAFITILSAVSIPIAYTYQLVIKNDQLTYTGVLMYGVGLLFGAVYLSIINGQQLENILTKTGKKEEEPKQEG